MTTLSINNDIMPFVYAYLDELDNTDGESAFLGSDLNSDIKKIVKNMVTASVRYVLLAAPNALLEGKLYSTNTFILPSFSWINLPNNFLRLVSVKGNGWNKAVQTVITEDSPSYQRLSNIWLGPGAENPAAALTHQHGKLTLELYPVCSSIDYMYIVTEPVLNNGDGIDVPDKLVVPCKYKIAADTLMALSGAQKAARAEQEMARFLLPEPEQERRKPESAEKILN